MELQADIDNLTMWSVIKKLGQITKISCTAAGVFSATWIWRRTEDGSSFSKVHVRANLTCNSQIEFVFYFAGYERICIQCGAAVDSVLEKEDFYPQCNVCDAKQQLIKRRAKKTQ